MNAPTGQNGGNQWFGWVLIIAGILCLLLVIVDQKMSVSHEETIVSSVLSFLSLIVGIMQAGIFPTRPKISWPASRSNNYRWLWIMSILLIMLLTSTFFNALLLLKGNPFYRTTTKPIPTTIINTGPVVSSTPSPITNPTATASPTSGPYGGTLAFKDTLRDDEQDHYFQTNLRPNNDSCKLTKQGYQITAANYFFNCDGPDTFADFVFQVTANVGTGSSAGLIFRHNGGGAAYIIGIDQSGCYGFNKGPNTVQEGYIQGHTSYQLTLVAKSNRFAFYVNGQKVADFKDSSYNSGTIGLMVTGDCKGSTANTQATYTDATVWKL